MFVVRWRRGSFPAAFKNIITVVVLVVVALVLLKEILDINVTSLIATTTVLTASGKMLSRIREFFGLAR